jgi:2-iminobutanoate/2-iminopropanoate deaminase
LLCTRREDPLLGGHASKRWCQSFVSRFAIPAWSQAKAMPPCIDTCATPWWDTSRHQHQSRNGTTMKKQVIKAGVPETSGPFNLCVRYGDMIYISGLPPFDEEYASKLREARAKGQPIPPFPDVPFERQVRIVMDHMKMLVEAAGSNMDCLLKVIVWLKDQRQQEEFDRIYRSYFSSTETLPARTRMQAGRTPMDCGLEVEAIGYVP